MDIPNHTREAEDELAQYGHLLARIPNIDLYTLRNLLSPFQLKRMFKQLFDNWEVLLPLQYKIDSANYFNLGTSEQESSRNYQISFVFYGSGKPTGLEKMKKSYKIIIESELGMQIMGIDVDIDWNNNYKYEITKSAQSYNDATLKTIFIISILSIRKFLYELYK